MGRLVSLASVGKNSRTLNSKSEEDCLEPCDTLSTSVLYILTKNVENSPIIFQHMRIHQFSSYNQIARLPTHDLIIVAKAYAELITLFEDPSTENWCIGIQGLQTSLLIFCFQSCLSLRLVNIQGY